MWFVCTPRAIILLEGLKLFSEYSIADRPCAACGLGIDQPVGAGFAQGEPTGLGTDDLAVQFSGFWKNFIDTFNMTGRKTYITGESYAGVSFTDETRDRPVKANTALNRNTSRISPLLFSPPMIRSISTSREQCSSTLPSPLMLPWSKVCHTYSIKLLSEQKNISSSLLIPVPMLTFVEANQDLLRYNSSFRSEMRDIAADFNYTSFFSEYFTFPASGPMPTPPNVDEGDSPFRGILSQAATLINPCFNVYHILDYCPTLPDPLSGPADPTNPSSGPFFNLTEVQDAMHAPHISWTTCSVGSVYAGIGVDQAPPASFSVLPNTFEGVPLNIVANGALDMLIPSVGTLFALQNVTWGGTTGFNAKPNATFIVPGSTVTLDDGSTSNLGPAGEMGTWGYERGVVFVDVAGAGHELPQYNPSAAFRLLEVLLGRVSVEEGMGGGAAWSVQPGAQSEK